VSSGFNSELTHETGEVCAPGTKGALGHAATDANHGIPAGEATGLTIKSTANPILKAKLFGAEVEFAATSVECVNCMAENKEVGGVMEVTGSSGTLTFSGVKVVGLETKCTVEGPTAEMVTAKPLKFTTTSFSGATLEPETGTTLAEFNIVANSGQTCNVDGLIKITGTVPAALSGSKLTVNITKASGALKISEGVEGKVSLTFEGTVLGGKTETPTEQVNHFPVSLTTTTP
jgi:hypothetical protein